MGKNNLVTWVIAGLIIFTIVSYSIGSVNIEEISGTDINNSFTAINASAVRFSQTNYRDCSGVTIYNSTGTEYTGNFSVSGCTATLADVTQNNTVCLATYTYNTNEEQIPILQTFGTLLAIVFMAIVVFMFVKSNKRHL